MSNVNMDGLPSEMQERIASIIEGAKQKAAAPQPQAPVPAPQPSLMDHMIALRQEVAAMRNEINAIGQVTEAVGNATGQLYQMFHQQTSPSDFSSNFQTQQMNDESAGDY